MQNKIIHLLQKNVLTITMNILKEQITPHTAPEFKNIVLRDLVNSPNSISAMHLLILFLINKVYILLI